MKQLLSTLIVFTSLYLQAQTLTPVSSFGSNPGNLKMYKYVPAGISGSAPLVMVLHGCTQTAQQAADQTGWNKLADIYKFYVVYPEQKSINNSSNCFNWFLSGDQEKNQGEDLSLKQMIDQMKNSYSIDTTKIYATGLSAGAAMTSVLCATYPEIFSAGAIMSGGPYKAATNAFEASSAMQGLVTNTATDWANLVFAQNPGYSGKYPNIAIFHGTSDFVVNSNNATELIKQWTAVLGLSQTASATITSYAGASSVTFNSYKNSAFSNEVRSYIISSFGHAIAIDTGSCPQQGGQTATYAYDINFHSTWHAAEFFGLTDSTTNTLYISGPPGVSAWMPGVQYNAFPATGNNFTWTIPAGATIANGQGTDQVSINFGPLAGLITVYKTELNGCLSGPASFWSDLCSCNGIEDHKPEDLPFFYNSNEQVLTVDNGSNYETLYIHDSSGKLLYKRSLHAGNNHISFRGISAGIYIIQATGKRTSAAKKIPIGVN